MNDKQLIQLKEDINNSKQELSELNGKLSNYEEQLIDVAGTNSLKEVQSKIEKIEKENEVLKQKLDKLKTKIENEYIQE